MSARPRATTVHALRGAARRVVSRVRRRVGGGDQGSAIVEFLGLSFVLLLPLVYLVMVLARLEAASYAVESAAREAARVYVAADDSTSAAARAAAVTGVALQDHGFDDEPSDALVVTCEQVPCLRPDAHVEARVQVVVPLPFVPDMVRDVVPLEIPVSSSYVAVVDEYRSIG